MLYLSEIRECFGERTADLKKLFPNLYGNMLVPAKWYTGELILRKQKWVVCDKVRGGVKCRKEIIIKIEKGKVISIKKTQ